MTLLAMSDYQARVTLQVLTLLTTAVLAPIAVALAVLIRARAREITAHLEHNAAQLAQVEVRTDVSVQNLMKVVSDASEDAQDTLGAKLQTLAQRQDKVQEALGQVIEDRAQLKAQIEDAGQMLTEIHRLLTMKSPS